MCLRLGQTRGVCDLQLVLRTADGHSVKEAYCARLAEALRTVSCLGAQDMRRLHGGAEPWARFHREYNNNDDIEVKPWEPEVWSAESNWQCRREISSSKPINIPAWLCRLLGAPLRTPGLLHCGCTWPPTEPCAPFAGALVCCA